MSKWTTTKYLAYALDPVHVGTGGERFGRVDMTVIREPALNVPKIPGTTLSGAIKFFLDLSLRDEGVKTNICASTRGSEENHEWEKCPVCYAFGYTPPSDDEKNKNDEPPESAQGILQFTDAQLFAFPVHTMAGAVWVTTKQALKEFIDIGDDKDLSGEEVIIVDPNTIKPVNNQINLGWVFLKKMDASTEIEVSDIEAKLPEKLKKLAKRMVVLPQWLFSHIVNDNLEVRTSVVIDPETGAAKPHALFTYEAVPRGAVFGFSIVENDYRKKWNNVNWDNKENCTKSENATTMIEKFAFSGIEAVGLGGMTTRGFGRMQIVPLTTAGKKGD